MTGNPFFRFASLLGLLIACAPAAAAVRTFTAIGTVTSVSDPEGLLAGMVDVADAFSAQYTYETSAPDQFPSNATRGRYALLPPVSIQTGSLYLNSSGIMFVDIINDIRNDACGVISQFTWGPLYIKEFSISLIDRQGLAFLTDTLPNGAPDLRLFGIKTFLIQGQALTGGPDFVISGTLTGITPEPTAFLMMLVVPGAVACRRANT